MSGTRGQDGLYVGGCAVVVHPQLASRVVKKFVDESGLGRYCGIQLKGKNGSLVTFISTYNAPNGSSLLLRQRSTLGKKDAQVAHWEDLRRLIQEVRAQDEDSRVVLLGDTNAVWSTTPQDLQRSAGKYTSWDKK